MAYAFRSLQELKQLAGAANYDAIELARLCHVSPRQLQRIFRREVGYAPQYWLSAQKILAAQNLLVSGRCLKQVAFDLRFKRLSHFCRQFKSFMGVTPSEFVSFYRGLERRMSVSDNKMSLRDNKQDSISAPVSEK